MRRIDRNESGDEDERVVRRASIGITLILLFIIAVLSLISFLVELKYGRKAGTIVLVVIAVILAAYLYRKEIGEFFRGKK